MVNELVRFTSKFTRCRTCNSRVEYIIIEGYVYSMQCIGNGHGYTFPTDVKVSSSQLESSEIDSLTDGFYFDPYEPEVAQLGQDFIDNAKHQLCG